MSVKIIQVDTLKRSDEELIEEITQDIGVLNCISQNKDKPQYKQLFATNLKILKSDINFFAENINYLNDFLKDTKFINVIGGIANSTISFSLMVKATVDMNNFDDCPIEKTIAFRKIYELTHNYVFEKRARLEKEKQEKLRIQKLEQIAEGQRNIEQGLANIIIEEDVPQVNQVNQVNQTNQTNTDSDNELELELKELEELEELEEELEKVEIKKEDIIEYKLENQVVIKDWKWEENQLETFTVLEKNGIETGIHCQATGCGKTYCILKYIGYFIENHKLYPKPDSKNYQGNIILFTERVNILADLFNFEGDSVDEANKKHWKEIGICDLDKVNVYNRVTIKQDDWDTILKSKSTKPNVIVINRAYLTRPEMYETLTKKHIGLVLHDECHSSISNQCHEFLKFCVENKINVVGFSATPIRTTNSKKSNDKNKSKLLEIYGTNGELKLLTNYNMIYACEKKLILEPIFYWYSIEMKEPLNLANRYEIKECHIEAVMNILSDVIGILPNQKIIAWCGTINFAEAWKEEFESQKGEHIRNLNKKRGFKFLADYDLYLDHSKSVPDSDGLTDYDKFKKSKGKSILFCAHKHREGSDIPKLDCCIFLDRTKTRSPIPFIQSIGRVLRKDRKDPNKKRGVVIDGIIDSCDEYAKFVVAKIYGYYLALANIAGNPEDEIKQEKYLELMDMLEFDQDNDKVKVKLNKDKTTIEIKSNQIKWKDISKKFDSILDNKLTEENKEIYKFKILRKQVRKLGLKSPEEYIKYATENELMPNPQIVYRYVWKGWYDFLNVDTSIYPESKEIWLNKCVKYGINHLNYSEKIKKYKNIPEFPQEIYSDFSVLQKELDENSVNNLINQNDMI